MPRKSFEIDPKMQLVVAMKHLKRTFLILSRLANGNGTFEMIKGKLLKVGFWNMLKRSLSVEKGLVMVLIYLYIY